MSQNRRYIYYPIIISIVLSLGIYLGYRLSYFKAINNLYEGLQGKYGVGRGGETGKFNELINYIESAYVDSVNGKDLSDEAISILLEKLDPHSSYIPAKELAQVNESLEGNFDGIGIEFNLLHDTIIVVSPIPGGPSETAGIRSGDRIITINGKNYTGVKITNEMVFKNLRGKKGTKVQVGVKRKGNSKLLSFNITRDKIPITSVDVYYMIQPEVGYIKISRFAATTYEEFALALSKLKSNGMRKLLLDLRGNPGGFLDAAVKMADEIKKKKKLIVYTEGVNSPRRTYTASNKGDYEDLPVVVLVDEGSASASEIIAGAIQDNDRGTIVGRRTFGKGLVQEQSTFSDGSAIRLTVAKYYTPTGRCIQKPYDKLSTEEYYQEEMHRYLSGELVNKDSVKLNKKDKFTTPKGKVVYGGGGVMPDVFVGIDTTKRSRFLNEIVYKGVLSDYCLAYVDANRNGLKMYSDVNAFDSKFEVTDTQLRELNAMAVKEKCETKYPTNPKELEYIKFQTKAMIARSLFKMNGYYTLVNKEDKVIKEALKQFN